MSRIFYERIQCRHQHVACSAPPSCCAFDSEARVSRAAACRRCVSHLCGGSLPCLVASTCCLQKYTGVLQSSTLRFVCFLQQSYAQCLFLTSTMPSSARCLSFRVIPPCSSLLPDTLKHAFFAQELCGQGLIFVQTLGGKNTWGVNGGTVNSERSGAAG